MVLSHGSMSYPLSRIYACYLEGPESPDTLACRDVIAAGGTQPLYDWNEVNLPDVDGQHQGRIPDGRLCSAGRDKYATFDQPRTDWYRTVLSPASSYTFRYAATAPHNQGYFEIYLTRPGYDPTQPLTWADLEPIARIDQPPLVAGYYLLEGVTLPADRVGHHLLYTIWQRTDSPEAFYACSDVWLGAEPTPTPTPAPACTEPAWQPGQLYETDSRVSHRGRVWQARWTNLDVEPDSEPTSGPWEIVGYCTAGEAGTPTPPPATPAATPTPTATAETTPAPSQGYTVQGNQILDPAGTPLLLRGVNWFGFETHDHVVHGLWARNWQEMIAQMADLGFNAVRIPICPATLRDSPVSSIDYSRNPDLQGLTSLAILDQLLQAFDQQGFYILLDHHRPDCNAISELWYTESYSEEQWIDDLVFMAQRYSHLPHFLGIDLKNEPHGSTTWGTGNQATDWDLAAARAAAAVLAANPNVLIFVEGIQENPTCSGNQNHWWGGNLEPLACTPLAISREKLVLSPHVYGPDVYVQPYFNHADFPANLPAIWEAHFGQFADDYPVVDDMATAATRGIEPGRTRWWTICWRKGFAAASIGPGMPTAAIRGEFSRTIGTRCGPTRWRCCTGCGARRARRRPRRAPPLRRRLPCRRAPPPPFPRPRPQGRRRPSAGCTIRWKVPGKVVSWPTWPGPTWGTSGSRGGNSPGPFRPGSGFLSSGMGWSARWGIRCGSAMRTGTPRWSPMVR